MPPLLTRGPLMALLLAALSSEPLYAQEVQGEVTERATGKPISGAVVQLLDSHGKVSSGVLTDASGVFSLRAPAPGPFRVRVERIGFETELSEVLDLVPGQVRTYPMVIASSAISLEGITVRGQSRGCSIRENGETVARVWEEARKALNALAMTQAAELVHFDTESFRRELDPATRAIHVEQRRSSFDHTENPFQSVPAEDLKEKGYVRSFADSTVYLGPDARVLLSDAFLDDHCFRLGSGGVGDTGLIGLEFRPARRVSRPDIEGTLWLDRKTSELRSVDYRYVGHRLDVPADLLGGRIEFERALPSGAWIVRRWVIRMPVVVQWKSFFTHPATHRHTEHTATRVTAVVEEGGEVVAISTPGPTRKSSGRAALSGTVVDSLTGKPLHGAIVFLSGTSFRDTTDSSGRYRISSVPGGRYTVSFVHPKLRALGITPSSRRSEIHPPSEATVDLAIPYLGSLLQRYCPAIRENEGMLVGSVKETRTGQPVARVQVRAGWRADTGLRTGAMSRRVFESGTVEVTAETGWVEVTTDDSGFFRVCGAPLESTVELQARVGESFSRRTLPPGRDRLAAQDLAIELK